MLRASELAQPSIVVLGDGAALAAAEVLERAQVEAQPLAEPGLVRGERTGDEPAGVLGGEELVGQAEEVRLFGARTARERAVSGALAKGATAKRNKRALTSRTRERRRH